MKARKILSLILALAMILSTASFSTFAEESVPGGETVTTVDEFKAALGSEVPVINLSKGEFDFGSEAITISAPVTIKGAGKGLTTLKFSALNGAINIASDNISISDLSMSLPEKASETAHISFGKKADGLYQNIEIKNVTFHGAKYGLKLSATDFTVSGCDFVNLTSHHIILYNIQGTNTIDGNNFGADFESTNKRAISFEGGADWGYVDAYLSSGTLNITNNEMENKGCFFIFNFWGGYVKGLNLNIANNNVEYTNKPFDLYQGAGNIGDEFNEIKINYNKFIPAAGKTIDKIIRDERGNTTPIDARYNYYGTNDADVVDNGIVGDAIIYVPYYLDEDMTEEATCVVEVNGVGYVNIASAISEWEKGGTMKLLADVTLPRTIMLKSSNKHTLELGEYVITSSTTVMKIVEESTGNGEFLTINSGNRGSIKAGTIITYKGDNTYSSRPVITIKGGIFDGAISLSDTKTPKMTPILNIEDGVFNGSIYTNRAKLKISGGTFNKSSTISVDSTSDMTIAGGRFVKDFVLNRAQSCLQEGIDNAADGENIAPLHKWTFGSTSGVYDRNIYVDEDGYFVVTNDNINVNDFPAAYLFDFESLKSTDRNHPDCWSTNMYGSFYYSKISSEYGNKLYFTNVEDALNFNTIGTVVLYGDYLGDIIKPSSSTATWTKDFCIDVTDGNLLGKAYLTKEKDVLVIKTTIDDTRTFNVVPYAGKMLKVVESEDIAAGTKTLTYSSVAADDAIATADIGDGKTYSFESLQSAVDATGGTGLVTLLNNTTETVYVKAAPVVLFAAGSTLTIDLNGKTLNGNIVVLENADVAISNGSVINKDANKAAITSSGMIELNGLNVISKGDAVKVLSGEANIESGSYVAGDDKEAVMTENGAEAEISSGFFSSNVDDFAANGIDVIRTANGFIVGNEEEQADSIYVMYKDVTKTEADAEDEHIYEIVVKANDNDLINGLESVDLSFEFGKTPLSDGEIDFVVNPARGFTLTPHEDKITYPERYMFSYSGNVKDENDNIIFEGTANAITIGTITVTGYGKYSISTKASDKNIVNATTVMDNLVDSYTQYEELDDATGRLIINADDNNSDDLYGTIGIDDVVEIKVPTRELTINIEFPNPVTNNVVEYQDMSVSIVGGNVDMLINLGTDGEGYSFTKELPYNTAYVVTVKGAGYRTARYTVVLTENKTLDFWNNVMTAERVIEHGKGTSAVTKNFLAGDIVGDSEINIYDLSAVVSYFGNESIDTTQESKFSKYDLNRDGKIDSKDVAYVLVSWGE